MTAAVEGYKTNKIKSRQLFLFVSTVNIKNKCFKYSENITVKYYV